jgi:predicted ribosomally synthesized peptide with SipW-like signal peptide
MRRKESDANMKSKVAGLFAVLLIALAVVGFSYAYWTETIKIEGSVATGELDAEFSAATCTDNESPPFDVGTCTVTLTDTDSDLDYDKATITILNAYPSYVCDVYLTIHNCGTIPLKVVGVTITNNNPDYLEVTLTNNPAGKTLAPSETLTFDLHIHITDNAIEKSTYSFSAVVDIAQFNAP